MSKAIQRYIVLTLLISLFPCFSLSAMQEEPVKISPYMLFTYLKNTDSQRILQVRMTNITPTSEVPLPGLKISLLNNGVVLGEAVTNVSGNAEYAIAPDFRIFTSDDGTWPFTAQFAGDSLVEAASG